jgi:hypothetical protein
MSIEIVRGALLWSAIINYGVLAFWGLIMVLPHGWLYRAKGRFYRISDEQFDAINYAGIVFYKVGIILFYIVPYIALRIVA